MCCLKYLKIRKQFKEDNFINTINLVIFSFTKGT